MAIQYAGGTIVNTTFMTGASTPATDMLNAIGPQLVTAGWTKQTDVAASLVGTFAGQPSDADTITLDSTPANKTYRFKSTMSAINDVQIGANLAATIANLSAAITAGAGAGTAYFTGTTAHTTMNVQASTATTITIQYITAGSAGNGAPVSKSCANLTLSASILGGGLSSYLSAITPQGLQCLLTMYTTAGGFYTPGTVLNILIGDRYGTRKSGNLCSGAGSGNPPISTTYRMIINKYQFCLITPSSRTVTTPGSFLFVGVPYIPSFQAPQVVVSASGSPIACNVPTHGLTTGNQVLTAGGLVNTNMNGIKTVTVTDANNYTLDGTTSNGTYTANSAYVANITANDRVVEAIYGCGTAGGGGNNFGNSITCNIDYSTVNSSVRTGGNDSGQVQIVVPVGQAPTPPVDLQWVNNNFALVEPLLAIGLTTGATPKLVGQMWDAVVVRKDITLEQAATFDTPSHTFLAVGIDATHKCALFLATS